MKEKDELGIITSFFLQKIVISGLQLILSPKEEFNSPDPSVANKTKSLSHVIELPNST